MDKDIERAEMLKSISVFFDTLTGILRKAEPLIAAALDEAKKDVDDRARGRSPTSKA